MKKIEFFWDPASPYTYLAATQIEALAARSGLALQWRPFLIGAVFQATGNRMPAAVPAKGKYLRSDVTLWARHYEVPLVWPETFPINSLLPQRVACALPEADLATWAQASMSAYWAEGRDIGTPEVVADVLKACGFDADAVMQSAQSQPVKDALRRTNEEAVERGVFGAPTFFVGERMFWGNDRLPLLDAWLSGKIAA